MAGIIKLLYFNILRFRFSSMSISNKKYFFYYFVTEPSKIMKKLIANVYIIILQVTCNYGHGIVMRNNALMSKMVSNFQDKEGSLSTENSFTTNNPPRNVLNLMQNVLCRNFPSIPCKIIIKDEKLNRLIEKSIQQIKNKKLNMPHTRSPSGVPLSLFPVINDEDLSKFLQVSETGYFVDQKKKSKTKKDIVGSKIAASEAIKKKTNKSKKRTSVFNGRKKIRKFYPHKTKYKDRINKRKREYQDYYEENTSKSVEMSEVGRKRENPRVAYRASTDYPVWRIDYMKHGEPNFNMFSYEADKLRAKMQTGPNVDENILEQTPRKDILHSDLYIKKNFVRKNNKDSDEI